MAMTIRPRRSVLYMPGSNARALEKARVLPVDGVILDLEDAVAPEFKATARDQVTAALAHGGFGRRERLVRINGEGTPWHDADVAAVAGSGADGIALPKVETAQSVRRVEQALLAAGAPESVRLWCMIETPLGVLNARDIAAASPRLGGLVMGTSDLTVALHAIAGRDRLPLLTSLGLCLLAARAHDLAILDGVHLDLGDEAGFTAVCRQGREMGFDGKTLIHPRTIALANEIFGPSAAEIADATKIIAAGRAAAREGRGVVVVEGRLVEALHVRDAERLLALATAIADG
ncbi:MAG: CoA ester lyase [Azospirillaceae bacterium]|nr:CoA ester lyase [Azospirillaceae bacterium]